MIRRQENKDVAHFLYDLPYDAIDAVIHPQSIIHSMVEFVDGTVLTSRNQLSGQTTFADATLHLADPSGSIRGTNVIAAGIGYTPGDSLRLVGEVSSSSGQQRLAGSTASPSAAGARAP